MIAQSTGNEITDEQPQPVHAVDLLLRLASEASVFRSSDGRFHASVPVGGRHDLLGLRSAAFNDWLANSYWKKYNRLPSEWALRRVLRALEAAARFETHSPPVFVRVGHGPADDESSSYLDLGDSSGKSVRIGASGWSIVDRPNVHFRRPQGLSPLPVPARDGSIELLRPYVNLSDSEFQLLIGWLAAALRPSGPYPILVIHGEQGSAKSTLARVVRQLIDPQRAALLAEPGSTRDLMVAALNGWLMVFDNISNLPDWLSDSFCRLASGGGFVTKALYSNDEPNIIYAQRPIVLNGIDEFVRKGDLADRGLRLYAPPVGPKARREELEFWVAFRQDHARILGGLLDVVAGANRELPSVHLAELPRMADFARFGEAVGRALNWPPETFLAAYHDNRKDATISSIESSTLGARLLESAGRDGWNNWTLPPTDMLHELTRGVSRRVAASAGWPKTPTAFSNQLRRLAPQLREHGIYVTFRRTRSSRTITLTTRPGSDYSSVTP